MSTPDPNPTVGNKYTAKPDNASSGVGSYTGILVRKLETGPSAAGFVLKNLDSTPKLSDSLEKEPEDGQYFFKSSVWRLHPPKGGRKSRKSKKAGRKARKTRRR